MAQAEEDNPFFERERDRLTAEITAVSTADNHGLSVFTCQQGFEELLPLSNQLNRKLEEVLGMTREYETIAELWHSFHTLMRNQKEEESVVEGQPQGLPGTGGHILRQSNTEAQQ